MLVKLTTTNRSPEPQPKPSYPPLTVPYELLELVPTSRRELLRKIEKYTECLGGILSMRDNIETPPLPIPLEKAPLQVLRRYVALLREEYVLTKKWFYLNTCGEDNSKTSDECYESD